MNKKLKALWRAHIVDDEPVEVRIVRPKLSEMRFGELMQSLKKGVDIEDLRRAERG
ncbi:hypothetical protein ACFSKY_22895 [Azotobacter chroococcum]|uniref:Uncharacterized protein n=1 Tax=Azotobacter chroococcum TaxID=353 RepID=A0A4R1PH58_9GAMM|nr:hypothetical protein [Azotobacter chroococcum]TCL26842.1 hypothetical protein EV691_12948 [Azotobacter chroococcum]